MGDESRARLTFSELKVLYSAQVADTNVYQLWFDLTLEEHKQIELYEAPSSYLVAGKTPKSMHFIVLEEFRQSSSGGSFKITGYRYHCLAIL